MTGTAAVLEASWRGKLFCRDLSSHCDKTIKLIVGGRTSFDASFRGCSMSFQELAALIVVRLHFGDYSGNKEGN